MIMIMVTLRIRVPGNRRKEFLDSARLILGPTKVQPGCISCRFYQDLNDPDTALYVEEWESWDSLEHHIKSDSYRIILSLMELSEMAPEINLKTISKTEGLEVIEALRS
jgi:quinol monooxygenase YgiN